MDKLVDAVERLERAVARLENAAAGRVVEGENALSAARAEYAALLAATDGVASRLDAAIGRLDRALEG